MTVKIWISGNWSGLGALRVSLLRARGMKLAPSPEEADVIVHATAGRAPRDELAVVREHSDAPALLLTSVEAPQSVEAVVSAAHELAVSVSPQVTERRGGRVATVFSPKGGAGASVVSTNLATALAAAGRRVLLVDLAAALRSGDAAAISDRRVATLLDEARAEYDAVVVDAPPLLCAEVLAALDGSDELVLLCTPDVPTIKDVQVTLRTLDLLSFPRTRVRVVLNRVHRKGGIRAAQVSSALRCPVDFELPEDDAVSVAGVEVLPESAFAQAAAALAWAVGAGDRRRARRFALGRRP